MSFYDSLEVELSLYMNPTPLNVPDTSCMDGRRS